MGVRTFGRRLLSLDVIRAGHGAGLQFDTRGSDPRFRAGNYEQPVQDTMKSHLHAGDVVYDIGANLGFISLLAARFVGPTGQVHAFEPVPANAARIARNAARNGFANVTVHETAISNVSGQADLLLAEHVGGAVLASAGAPPDPAGRITVDLTAIDHLVGTPPPTFVKIDVEGAELEVLQGMRTTATRHRPTILCEIDAPDRQSLGERKSSIVAELADLGYAVRQLSPSYPQVGWCVEHLLAT